MNSTLDLYQVNVNEKNEIEIKTKDGLKPLSEDGTKTLTFEEIIDNQLNSMKVVRQSNAEPGSDKIVKENNKITEDESSESSGSQRTYALPGLKAAAQNAQSLKEMKTFGL